MTPAKTKFSRRGIFLLPNLFTTGALFAGFYSIVAAVDGNFQNAGAAIFVAFMLDGIDGRVAWLTEWNVAWGRVGNGSTLRISQTVPPGGGAATHCQPGPGQDRPTRHGRH